MIFLPVKFLDESAGLAEINIGGRESLTPPVGGIWLAQPVFNTNCGNKKERKSAANRIFMGKLLCIENSKLKGFAGIMER